MKGGDKKMPDKNTINISQTKLIKNVSKNFGKHITVKLVEQIINEFEREIFRNLHKANENTTVIIRPFEGYSISAEYRPAKQKKLNLTGETITTKPRINIKAKTNETYIKKFNNPNFELAIGNETPQIIAESKIKTGETLIQKIDNQISKAQKLTEKLIQTRDVNNKKLD